MEGCRSVMAALSENMLTVSMLLNVFFFSGVQTGCYKPALSITAPEEMEALSGSCLLIPCSFREKTGETIDGRRKTFGVWIKSHPEFKDNHFNVIYNSSKPTNIYNMNITGNLKKRNCTTVFFNVNSSQTDKYFFRVENGPFKATASCHPVNITVRDSAWRPRIEISGDVKEKDSVTITCSALTPCPQSPPELTWNLQPDSPRQIEENTDGTFRTKIQQIITLSDTHDGYNIICSVRYPVDGGKHSKTAKTEVTLSLSYAPKNTSAPISLSADSWVYLNCSSRAKPPISCFTWFKKSKHGAMKVAEGDVRLTVSEGGIHCCEAKTEGVLITLIILPVVAVIVFLLIWFLKNKRTAAQHNQTPAAEELALQIPTNERQEDLHYEDVKFIKKPSCVSQSSSNEQQETLYAQVQVSKVVNRSSQTADGPEDLYSSVQ
ncbi:B-cell receptor CD22-like [Cyprinodon tularosa]|uniref:B-cell receptor CD22-like n=1 Tax=Cyprinodon tularosa TaxID=77115 RepID=UPI0018E1EA0A|nr:B-cell receptor CD22-like [Cyprinodon tularosa]